MAKKKQEKAQAKTKNGKPKAKAAKLPKRVAGVKVPKGLREPGAKLLEAVNQPVVLDIAAAALMAAANRLRDQASKAKTASEATAATQGKGAPDLGSVLALTAVEAIRKMADPARRSRSGGSGRESKGEDA